MLTPLVLGEVRHYADGKWRVTLIVDIQSGLYVLCYTGPGAESVEQIALAEGNVIDNLDDF